MSSPEVRAARMVRWYPASWRSTHDTEFVMLLEDSLAERPFWPRRGIGVAREGTRLRLIDVGQRAATAPVSAMSFGALWLAISMALFLGYSLLFLSTASTAYAHGFEALTAPVSIVGGSLIIAFGAIVLMFGLRTVWHERSWRSCWPLVTLGAALIGLVATNWWFSSDKGLWGWTSTATVVAGLNPESWTASYRGPSDFHLYLIANLLLLAVVATALIAISYRLLRPASQRHRLKTRIIGFLLLIAATAGVWIWVVSLTGRSASSWPIAGALTVSAFSTLAAALFCSRTAPRCAT